MMDQRKLIKTSKFLSKVLRHDPGSVGVVLDEAGWADLDEVIAAANRRGYAIDRESIREIMERGDKPRFALSEDGSRIRASHGHTVDVRLGLTPERPPDLLYHGTADVFVDAIKRDGLVPQRRQYVHLSSYEEAAAQVGRRHGNPIVLVIDSARMWADGWVFHQSASGIWLTEWVPSEYIVFP